MKNLDSVDTGKTEVLGNLSEAMGGNDPEKLADAMSKLCEHIQGSVIAEAKGLISAADASVLASRGASPLTSKEQDYYSKVIGAMKSSDPKAGLSVIDDILPETVIDRVFEDLAVAHPLLSAIRFANTSAITKWIMNDHDTQLAAWGELTGEITEEIVSAFKVLDMSMFKLSAFMPVANAMLDLGPAWLDRYVRAVLAEALALALEKAIVSGTGNNQPIGMDRDLEAPVVLGSYAQKTAVALTSLDSASYGAFIAANLAKTAKGSPRTLSNILMVVNPSDYLKKVLPATTVRSPQGDYVNNVLPFPTTIIQSVAVEEGKAVFGIADNYFMGIGAGTAGGKLEYDDSYKFLEDQRVYRIKLYGNGRPMDNVSFVLADISGLLPLVREVKVVTDSVNEDTPWVQALAQAFVAAVREIIPEG